MLCLLAPAMQTDLRAAVSDAIYMMDASPNLALRELGLEREELFGPGADAGVVSANHEQFSHIEAPFKDSTEAFDCIELFSGQGNWSKAHMAAGLKVHPGIERDAHRTKFGDLFDNSTFRGLPFGIGTPDHHAGRSAR